MTDLSPGGMLSEPSADDECAVGPGLVSVARARALLLHGVTPVAETEDVALSAATGRVLATECHSALDLPPFDRSAVDGYALGGIGPGKFTLKGQIHAGDRLPSSLEAQQAVLVLTGAAIPDGAVSVAMREHTAREGQFVATATALRPGENIRRRGEDAPQGAVLLKAGTVLDARHVALLASAGLAGVTVRRRVRVALLSTGNELHHLGDMLEPGGIFDSNRPMLAAELGGAAVEIVDLGVLPDDPTLISEAFSHASQYDAVIASGGVAGSEADHMLTGLRLSGGHGEWMPIALKPGKPLVFGWTGKARCLFLPGNPVAAYVGATLFARPLLFQLAGHSPFKPRFRPAISAANWKRSPGREEFAPARIVGYDQMHRLVVERMARAGSARLVPLAEADGLVRVAANQGSVGVGDPVEFLAIGPHI